MADVAMDAAPAHYCVCKQVEDTGSIMIECIRGTGGCNGWVHPRCCGLILTPEELETSIDSYICPLCEAPGDHFTKMKALNTKLANKLALKLRKKAEAMKERAEAKLKWKCKACGDANDKDKEVCGKCAAPRKRVKKPASEETPSKKPKHSLDDEKKTKKKIKTSDAGNEDDDDSSKRRSGRDANKRRKNYHVPNSDEDLSDMEMEDDKPFKKLKKKKLEGTKKRKQEPGDDGSDDDGSDDGEAEFEGGGVRPTTTTTDQVVAPSMVIEKIMSSHQRELPLEEGSTQPRVATEYYIKWKGFAYLHTSWETLETLLDIDPANKLRIKRFHEKYGQPHLHHQKAHHHESRVFDDEMNEMGEVEYFNPEYLEVHRILNHRQDPPMPADPAFPDAPADDGMRYLVKWRVLSYAEATWERACDIKDDDAIAKYHQHQIAPPKEEWEPLPRPTLRDYRKLDTSPLFGHDKTLTLRAYQLEGLNWLMWNYLNERPSILADEMGLGKTIQTLAFLDALRSNEKIKARGPFLVVAPLSLIAQWQSECETWTSMNCVVYHGNTEARDLIREYDFYFFDEKGRPDKKKPYKFNILVTTYEIAIKDISILMKIRWRCLVVDEAHRLKNQSSRLVEQLRSLRRDHCVLLTGTPLQNKTEELWALLNFLDSKSFPSVSEFLDNFGDLHEAQQVVDLHKMLKPYLLRRQKEDVEKSLPPKEETIIEVELTPVQKQWYRAIYERNTAFLSRGGNPNNVPNLMNVMMELRKCCNHPYLNNGVEERLNEGITTEAQRHEMMVKCCGKMVLIDKLLPRLKEGGHKVLIFSQMVRVLDIIEDYLRYMGYLHERLDGNIRGNDRQAAVDRFVKPEYNRFVMLLSTKAGGLGLNLTAADTVIIFDSDWNPQNDLQAQARAHRIGQTHSVKIYRLITRKTYEMHMFHKASLKLGLDKAVLTHMRREQEENNQKENGGVPKKMSSKAQEAKEIDELLKRGAYDVFRDDDQEAEQFCAADIDQILSRSSQVVQYEQEAKSSFSKASFVSATTSDDVDIDDPDFWKKAVGLKDPEPSEDPDALPLQRKRTRVARFGTNTGGLSDSDSDDELDRKEREADRKDREREEKEKEKADEKKEPRDWTQNGRDRLQRALMHYGFGRWEIIRSQSGGSRTVEEVEQFAREFIYACGLSCTETTASSRDDSPFVKAMIRASVHAQKEGLVDENEMSTVLKDEDFVLKLKQGGGRRVLIRLDMLWRLRGLVSAALDSLDEEFKATHPQAADDEEETKQDKETDTKDKHAKISGPPPPTAEFDDHVAFYGVDVVKNRMQLAEVGAERPPWTQITSWWNEEADRSLLIGVFLLGYGRCAQILGDDRLRFMEIAQAAEAAAKANASDATSTGASGDVMSSETTTTAHETDDEQENGALKKESIPAADSEQQTTNAVGDDKKFKQPEVQQMNRLLFWLLSADDVKRQKELEVYKKERAGIEQQRQSNLERKQRASALRRIELKASQLAQVDMFRHMGVLSNAQQMPDPVVIGSKIKPKDWTKEERRSFAYLIALHGAPRIDAKASLSVDPGLEQYNVPRFAWETDSFSWINVVQWGKLNKTAEMARDFFMDRFLPKCREIAAMKLDPLGSDQRATALADLVGIEFVDAHEGVLAHGLKARNVAWVSLRRISLFNDICDLLTHRKPELLEFLRSGSPDLVDKMPVWWCPWVHDLGIFYGMARHGISAWERLLLDRQLPFHRQARVNHIRQVFLEGTDAFDAVYKDRFKTVEEANAWLARVVEEFPSLALLERKVHVICELLLPDSPNRFEGFSVARTEEFTFPTPGNAVEIEVMKAVRVRDQTPRNPFAELTQTGIAQELAAFLNDSTECQQEYLLQLMDSSESTTTSNGHATEEPHAETSPPHPTPSPKRHSQIPIHMLVS